MTAGCTADAGTAATGGGATVSDAGVLSGSAEAGSVAAAGGPGTDASTVSGRSGGGLLASVPVLGDAIEGELPMTGTNILTLAVLAAAAMLIGLFFVRGSRRKADTAG